MYAHTPELALTQYTHSSAANKQLSIFPSARIKGVRLERICKLQHRSSAFVRGWRLDTVHPRSCSLTAAGAHCSAQSIHDYALFFNNLSASSFIRSIARLQKPRGLGHRHTVGAFLDEDEDDELVESYEEEATDADEDEVSEDDSEPDDEDFQEPDELQAMKAINAERNHSALSSSDEEDDPFGIELGPMGAEGSPMTDLNLDDLISGDYNAGALQQFGQEDDFVDDVVQSPVAPSEEEPAYTTPPQRVKTLGSLLRAAGYRTEADLLTQQQSDVEINNVQWDPRKVDFGGLFVCMNATGFDGHDFTECVAENGAAAMILEHPVEHDIPDDIPVVVVGSTLSALGRLAAEFLDNPSRELVTVGVTGSAGKTTTSWLIRGIFEELGQLTGMLGTLEYAISTDRLDDDGDLWEPVEEDPTLERDSTTPYHLAPYQGKYIVEESTPDALAMQKILAGVADRGGQSAVVECTTTGIKEGRLDDVDLDVAVFTNVSEEHLLQYEGTAEPETMSEHVAVMATLFSRLTDPDRQRAVVNVDDPFADQIRQAGIKVPVVTFAVKDKEADVVALKHTLTPFQTTVLVSTPAGKLEIKSPLIGLSNVYNILAAVAVGIATSVDLKAIVMGIEAVDLIPGRTELIDEGQNFPVIVDCANTPASLTRLLTGVRAAGAKRLLTVFGAEGLTTSKEERAEFGTVLDTFSDFVFITNNNPRLEQPEDIVEDTVAGFRPAIHKYEHVPGLPHWLVDVNRVPDIPSDFMTRDVRLINQGVWRRFIMEDRFSAIRVAIGTAQDKDAVIIAGKGAEDFQEFGDFESGDILRGWFDDRVEARNALSKLPLLRATGMDTTELPWCSDDDDCDRGDRIDILMDTDTRQFK